MKKASRDPLSISPPPQLRSKEPGHAPGHTCVHTRLSSSIPFRVLSILRRLNRGNGLFAQNANFLPEVGNEPNRKEGKRNPSSTCMHSNLFHFSMQLAWFGNSAYLYLGFRNSRIRHQRVRVL